MGRLLVVFNTSLDGRIADADGDFGWGDPSAEVHSYFNDMELSIGTHLYGRRLYETMRVWQDLEDEDPIVRAYGEVWRDHEKVVYSRTLDAVTTPRTRLVRQFDPAEVRREVDAAAQDVSVGGAELAAIALRAGIVDEIRLIVVPHLVGSGPRALPDGVSGALELLEERRFDSGSVLLRYRIS